MEDEVVIHSWRDVYRTRWRIYRFLEWRIPVPGGIPVVGIAWWAAGAAMVWILRNAPATSSVFGILPWIAAYSVIPFYLAMVMMQSSGDGRSMFRRMSAKGRLWWRRQQRARARENRAGAPVSIAGPRPVTGPVLVKFGVPVRLSGRGERLKARASADGQVGPVVLKTGEEIRFS